MVDILQRELGTSFACEYIPNPYVGRYQFHTEADIETTKAILGYTPRFEFEEGIAAYVPEIKRLFEEELS
jgi:ADP-L-glycero-D-manno-heptose 6-epimerase